MGTLYLAHDPVLDRTVALKLFHGDLERPDARDKFVGEARAVAALNHPNIVTIYDYGEYASQPFLVMEYIQGETLADVIRRKPPMSPVVTVRWIEDLCSAVGYAHERGIIHRDLKPANLMVDAYGRLKVLDFGIARMRGTLASHSTAVIGTPGYVAPEQIRGGTIDHRSDIFSIGVVAYELFSFTEPFGAETMHAITHRTLNDKPVPLDEVRPSIDPELAATVARALRKGTEERYQTAEELRDALASVRRRIEAAEPDATVVMYVPPVLKPQDETVSWSSRDSGNPGTESTAAPGADQSQRRTSRQHVSRPRHTQVQEWIDLAREHLAAGELAEAREACNQVLGFEPDHRGALSLLSSLDQMASATIVRPSGRSSPPAADPDDAGYTVLLPAKRRTGPVAPAAPDASAQPPSNDGPGRPARAADEEDSRARVSPRASARASGAATPRVDAARRPWGLIAAAAAAILALGGISTWMMTRNAAPPPAVMVVLDATPWATVASIETEDGERQPLPADPVR